MKKLLLLVLAVPCIAACNAQQSNPSEETRTKQSARHIGGPCEGCEAIYEYGSRVLTSIDTLPDFDQHDNKIKITGIIYQNDGETPAKDVILYVYHTNEAGIYPTRGDEKGWAKRHGYIRGWVKTGDDGKYTFYTFKPGSYPGGTAAAHIHPTIKEPGLNEYYIDTYHFKDDPLLKKSDLSSSPRAGSGLLTLEKQGDMWVARRDIILGVNIPDYK
ncbi:intradiol ring-cleavage dioxygenase [Fulvivirga ulvae]|uniref:intradiol ring-cleavage dioxygenase n=1 Tax=Fulvivirga ulvae TaxID=2904245 RepID=UPI001F2634E7|nr:intradiol ring-cleavage dioxygenase [Fulvivirga ulvae]UII32027.1 intradiol ring-cleavage dioxygenase [Fulvivirga ulvae]